MYSWTLNVLLSAKCRVVKVPESTVELVKSVGCLVEFDG